MKVNVHYQGLEPSTWLEGFISSRLTRLERYLNGWARIQVNLKYENNLYTTRLVVHGLGGHTFTASGENLYESFVAAIDKASRTLGEEKRKLKDKINRKYFSVKKMA